jgi:hypothetical protein
VGVASRVSRLTEPQTPARRVCAHLLLAAVSGLVLAAPLLTAWAAASGTFAACALMP